MEEILHQLIGSLSRYLQGFFTSKVVQDFSHQQYHPLQLLSFHFHLLYSISTSSTSTTTDTSLGTPVRVHHVESVPGAFRRFVSPSHGRYTSSSMEIDTRKTGTRFCMFDRRYMYGIKKKHLPILP